MKKNFIPEFLTDGTKQNKSLLISNALIVLKGEPNEEIKKTYMMWNRKAVQKATGIIIPEIVTSGRAH